MLSARAAALGAWREVRALGHGPVLGAQSDEVAAGRLRVTRQAERVIMRACGTERSAMTEPDDTALDRMLTEVRAAAATYEAAAGEYAVRGGPTGDEA